MRERIVCVACGGTIAAVRRQTLAVAVEVHSATCPAVARGRVKSSDPLDAPVSEDAP